MDMGMDVGMSMDMSMSMGKDVWIFIEHDNNNGGDGI